MPSLRRYYMPTVWALRSLRSRWRRTRTGRAVAAAARGVWWTGKRFVVVGTVLSVLAASLAVYEGVAPPDWPRPTHLWKMPRPVLDDVSIVVRTPILDPTTCETDQVTVRVVGQQLPESRLADDFALLVLVRLAGDSDAQWMLGLKPTSLDEDRLPASLPASAACRDNWELVVGGLTCDESYSGDIEAMAVFVPATLLDDLADAGDDAEALRSAALDESAIRSNARGDYTSAASPDTAVSPYRQVSQLAANLSLDTYRDILGREAFRLRRGEYWEYSFVQPDFYTYAIVDENDTVVFYCVTTRTESFCPIFEFWDGIDANAVQLGVTTFAEVGDRADVAGFMSGATASSRYYEIVGYGNPGYYQTFLYAWNDAGHLEPDSFTSTIFELNDALDAWPSTLNPTIAQFRREAVVNTFGLTGPDFYLEDFIESELQDDFLGGVSRIQVRVLRDGKWE